MAKKIAKTKTLTVRLNTAEKVKTVDRLMDFTRQATATGALLYAAEAYVLVYAERDRLRSELEQLIYKHDDLIDDIKTGLDAQARVLKAIGRK